MSVTYSPKVSQLESELRANLNQQATLSLNLKSPETRSAFDKLQAQEVLINGQLGMLKQIESKLGASAAEQQAHAQREAVSNVPNEVAQHLRSIGALPSSADEARSENRLQELRKSFAGFIKDGARRDLISSTDGQGEATVPVEFGVLTQATKLFGPIAGLVNVQHENNGRAYKQPISNDVSNYATISGQGNSGPEGDPTVLSATPNTTADSLRTKTIASIQLVQDAAAGGTLEQYLFQLFGVRIGRSMEHLVTLGTDPAGNVAAASPAGGLLASLSPLTVTTAVANSLQWTDFVNAASAIDPSYLRGENSRWFMNWGTMMTLAAQKDTTGRPLWTPNAQGGIDSILGIKVELNQALPNIAANSTPVVLGDASKAYSITTSSLKVQRFQQAPGLIENNLVELNGYVRVSGVSLLPSAMGTIKIAAS
jgi:HK97 family phage major capsid protein